MQHHRPNFLFNVLTIITMLVFSLFNTGIVFADDATPPTPTEEPAQPPVEEPVVATEPAVVSTEEPVAITEPAVVPTEEAVATVEPIAQSTEEAVSLPEILEQLPDDTAVVVIVDGEVEPLATQEAADAIVTGDPMWCPEGATPGNDLGEECTPGQHSLNDLIDMLEYDWENGILEYGGPGTIYISYNYAADDPFATFTDAGQDIVFDYWSVGLTDLTVQGGWVFDDPGTPEVEDYLGTARSDLTGINSLNFLDWGYGYPASLTIKDIIIDSAGWFDGTFAGSGLYVGSGSYVTEGNVTLDNVSVTNSYEDGAYLETSGDIVISDSEFHDNDGKGADIEADGDVEVTNSDFYDNGYEGLDVRSSGDITLSNVTANGNGSSGASGAFLKNTDGTGSINVSDSIFGNIENGNHEFGLEAYSNGEIALHTVTANGNGLDGVWLENDYWGSTGSITVDQNSTFNDNGAGEGGSGLVAVSNGNVTISQVTTSENAGIGTNVWTGGNVTLSNVTANDNASDGAYLENDYGGSTGSIIVSDSFFGDEIGSGNGNAGLQAYSNGDIILSQVTANGNGSLAQVDDCADGYCYYYFWGDGTGLWLESWGGSITLNVVQAKDNYGDGVVLWGDEISIFGSTFNNNGKLESDNLSFFCGVDPECIAIYSGFDVYANGLYASHQIESLVSISCSQANNNAAYGYDIYTGDIILNSATASGNGWEDFYTEADSVNIFSDPCGTTSGWDDGDNRQSVSGLPIQVIPVSGLFDCSLYSGTLLVLPNGDRALFPCPLEDEGKLDVVADGGLPGNLPDGMNFVSSFTVHLLKNGAEQETVNPSLTVSFTIPDGVNADDLAILFWDGSNWVEVDNAYVSADGYFEAKVDSTGTYVLVTK